MKKTSLFLLISLLAIPGNCFADDDDEEFLKQFIRGFKGLPIEQQVEKLANAQLVNGYIKSVPDLADEYLLATLR